MPTVVRAKASRVYTALITLACLVCACASSRAADEQAAPVDRNVKLRIQLDRTSIRAHEPVYLFLVAEQFAAGDVEIQVSKDKGEYVPVQLPAKAWTKAELGSPRGKPIRRMGAVLLSHVVDGKRQYVFGESGSYRVTVRVGSGGGATLDLAVTAPEPGERPAWDSLTDAMIEDIISNNFADEPVQATIDACANVMRKYPRTTCAGYCQSYLSITKFKIIYLRSGKGGGKTVYGNIADELVKVATVFREGYFGEMTAFYAAYAKGLAKDYDAVLATIGAARTRMTIWGDAIEAMQAEVLQHVGPRVIPVDPAELNAAATQPSSASQPAVQAR